MRARAAAETPKCVVGSCKQLSSGRCTWRLNRLKEDGDREYTGRTCDLELCEGHSTPTKNGRLCAWHTKLAKEQGLL